MKKLRSVSKLVADVPATENRSVGGSIPPLGTISLFSAASFHGLGYAIAPRNILIIHKILVIRRTLGRCRIPCRTPGIYVRLLVFLLVSSAFVGIVPLRRTRRCP